MLTTAAKVITYFQILEGPFSWRLNKVSMSVHVCACLSVCYGVYMIHRKRKKQQVNENAAVPSCLVNIRLIVCSGLAEVRGLSTMSTSKIFESTKNVTARHVQQAGMLAGMV